MSILRGSYDGSVKDCIAADGSLGLLVASRFMFRDWNGDVWDMDSLRSTAQDAQFVNPPKQQALFIDDFYKLCVIKQQALFIDEFINCASLKVYYKDSK